MRPAWKRQAGFPKNQDIKIRLSASHVHTDFSRGEVDIDIRYGLIRWQDLHVETIFAERSCR